MAGGSVPRMGGELQLLHTIGNTLANSQQWPNWGRGSEFRAARDASASERG